LAGRAADDSGGCQETVQPGSEARAAIAPLGFAAMTRARRREIASSGGRAAHELGRAHVFTSDEARSAGRKGGTALSRDRAHMAAIGRKGGQSRRLKPKAHGAEALS
jgi:general stress protein YciG